MATTKKAVSRIKPVDKLKEMVQKSPTQYWNDSCSIPELKYALARGATGATTNPVIVKKVFEDDFDSYKKILIKTIKDFPNATEDDITWFMIEHAAKEGAKQFKKIFNPKKGVGRLSIQTNTKFYKNSQHLTKQAIHFGSIAPNIQVKIPATTAGIQAIEQVTYQGISINATVCFTVAQSLAVAEAVQRALVRRQAEGKDISTINPVCTIMVGRVDDWLKIVASRDNIIVDPECLEWAGVATMKRAYEIYKEKQYTTKLLAAAYRNHYQWSEFIGGDVIETIPYVWQVKFNNSNVSVKNRIDNPVDKNIITQLLKEFPDFKKAYEPKALSIAKFDSYGATAKTLLQFAQGYDDLVKIIRSQMIIVP